MSPPPTWWPGAGGCFYPAARKMRQCVRSRCRPINPVQRERNIFPRLMSLEACRLASVALHTSRVAAPALKPLAARTLGAFGKSRSAPAFAHVEDSWSSRDRQGELRLTLRRSMVTATFSAEAPRGRRKDRSVYRRPTPAHAAAWPFGCSINCR
jgi:hypothetical protein